MLTSTPSQHYRTCDSPSYPTMASTPPRFKSGVTPPFHSPMLSTPSPLKCRNSVDPDDVFSNSPSTSRLAARRSQPSFSMSHPLRTPVKEAQHRRFPTISEDADSPVGLGAKRKPPPSAFSSATPLSKRVMTPLKTAALSPRGSVESFAFERLAPLTAPRFSATHTPHTRVETEIAVKRQADTMKKLKICDLGLSEEESDVEDLDRPRLFLSRDTDVSPGGHVSKRRLRSRPVSNELLEDAADSPFIVKHIPQIRSAKRPNLGPITFPTSFRTRNSSVSSSGSDCASPIPAQRLHVGAGARTRTQSQSAVRPFNRHASNSSASLFFGPSIPDPNERVLDSPSVRASAEGPRARAQVARHSCTGSDYHPQWDATPSRSPPFAHGGDEADLDDFFAPSDSSFAFTVMGDTPNSRSRTISDEKLTMKYKPRDSGVSFDDDDEDKMFMPAASTSVSTIYSGDEGLVTPITGPSMGSGWPTPDNVTIVNPDEDFMRMPANTSGTSLSAGTDADGFIMRLLVGGAQPSKDHRSSPKMPGTPVKKVKTTHFAVARPWASAFTSKIGSEEFNYLAPAPGKEGKGKKPRKSLPAAFPMLMSGGSGADSPTERKETKYSGLGLGRPRDKAKSAAKPHWLLRRSSSGAFSSSGENARPIPGSPTRLKGKGDFKLPPPRIPAQFSPLNKNLRLSSDQRSISSSSTASAVDSPTSPRFYGATASVKRRNGPSPFKPRYSNVTPSSDERPGKFESDFTVIDDDFGSGEFGRVLKVRRIVADDEEFISMTSKDENVFAVKKSKPMEGVKHRLRLREEVDVLRHLSRAAADGRGHPNVLGYVDSWEQDGVLYIQTELCELGSFGHFLWEYGRAFPRLDEARVWKILADLSNGMLFIHDNGIIHLDLKPANIFVNGDGRFKIGDFGMASVWPRPTGGGFEREGDKEYMAPEILQGRYGKAADIFGFGMTMLETAANIVVPGQGDAWHRLRQENFEQVELEDSPELFDLIKSMMRSNAALRVDIPTICSHPVVSRTRAAMERIVNNSGSVFAGSPLASVPAGFLCEILDRGDEEAMDMSP